MSDEIANETNKKPDECFIITPIGSENAPIRREIEGVIFSVIEPILKEFDLVPVVAHKISSPGSINNQVIQHIVNDKLVIANLTDLNPNVMYELAIRHATKKPVIHICKDGTVLPFDIKTERTLFYKNDMQGVIDLQQSLQTIISEALSKEEWDDNPIFTAVKFDIFSKTKTIGTDSGSNEFLANTLQAIQDDIKYLKRMQDINDIDARLFYAEAKSKNFANILIHDHGAMPINLQSSVLTKLLEPNKEPPQ